MTDEQPDYEIRGANIEAGAMGCLIFTAMALVCLLPIGAAVLLAWLS